jgi:hypothetical protein
MLAAARDFNKSDSRRSCRACGGLHPVIYGMHATNDLVEEAASREFW